MLTILRSSGTRSIFILLFVCSLGSALKAQLTEGDIKARLMNQPLFLRGCWGDDKLHFDSVGNLKDKSSVVPFTLCGFEFKDVHLKQDKLILQGRRIGLELKDDEQFRVPLNAGKIGSQEDESIHLEVAASPTGDYGPALDAIFVNGLPNLIPLMPAYWKPYSLKYFTPMVETDASTTEQTSQQPPAPKPARVGGAIKAPKLLYAKEPTFNDFARRLQYSGVVVVNLHLEPDGKVTNLSIVHALGMGLDERALAAVQKYTFSPATQNGIPVLVELNVEINFEIY
jgi:TonB family protein